MKIQSKVSDTANGPSDGLMHKLEYKHAVDTICLKNDDLSGVLFTLKTIFFQTIRISLHRSLKLVDDDIILQKIFWLYFKICAKVFYSIAHNRIHLGLGSRGYYGTGPENKKKVA